MNWKEKMSDKPSVALLVIGTKKYYYHGIECINSFREFWDDSSILHPILFTDHMEDKESIELGTNTQLIQIEHLPWPLTTLLRFNRFLNYKDLLSQYDYLLFVNANARANTKLGKEFLNDIVAVEHPGWYNRSPQSFPYDNKSGSEAHINQWNIRYPHYCQGFLQGGSSTKFLEICKYMQQKIDRDLYNNYIALWHDESYWNNALQQYQPTKLLDPGYAYPESWDLPFEKKIISLDKKHEDIRKE